MRGRYAGRLLLAELALPVEAPDSVDSVLLMDGGAAVADPKDDIDATDEAAEDAGLLGELLGTFRLLLSGLEGWSGAAGSAKLPCRDDSSAS